MSRSLRAGLWVAVFLVCGVCGTLPGEVAAQEKQPPGKAEAARPEPALQRRKPTTEEELRRQLQDVPEAGFDQQAAGELYTPIINAMKGNPPLKHLPQDLGMTALQDKAVRDKRPEVGFFPWLTGPDNVLVNEEAVHLQTLSFKLRLAFQKSAKKDEATDAEKLSSQLAAKEWAPPAVVRTITQMLQAEPADVRLLLV